MTYKYGTLSAMQIHAYKERLTDCIWKLLPLREEKCPTYDVCFKSLMHRIDGLNKLFLEPPEIIMILTILEGAYGIEDFAEYRKEILDATNLVASIKESDEDV